MYYKNTKIHEKIKSQIIITKPKNTRICSGRRIRRIGVFLGAL